MDDVQAQQRALKAEWERLFAAKQRFQAERREFLELTRHEVYEQAMERSDDNDDGEQCYFFCPKPALKAEVQIPIESYNLPDHNAVVSSNLTFSPEWEDVCPY